MQQEQVENQKEEEIICTGKPYPLRMGELEYHLRDMAKSQGRSISWVILNYCKKGLTNDGVKIDKKC